MDFNKLFVTLLNYEFYEKSRHQLNIISFEGVADRIMIVLNQWHHQYERTASLLEFKEYFYSKYPAMTDAAKDNHEILFNKMSGSEQVGEDLLSDLILEAYRQQTLRNIADAAMAGIEGDADAMEKVVTLVDDAQDNIDPFEACVAVASDMDSIIDGIAANSKWKWNLPKLDALMPGIGGGIFSIVFARVELGKTAFWLSATSGKGGFVEQGANVHAFINEEPAVRTMGRAICANTQTPFATILADTKIKEAVGAEFAQYRENTNMYDCIGMSMQALEDHVRRTSPDIVIIDQLDKMSISGVFAREDQKLEAIYIYARNIAKKYDCAVIGITQAGADAAGKDVLEMSMMNNSKTGKAAEGDLVIGVGHNPEMGKPDLRCVNVLKNKHPMGGHGHFFCMINGKLSTYHE